MQEQNRELRTSLSAARAEISDLKINLETVCIDSLTDALTKLPNRRCFDWKLVQEMEKSRDTGAPLSLLLVDVDHFKSFNDRFGHLIGDQVLRLIAMAIQQTVRGQDSAARYGGEEFAIILPNTSFSQAFSVAENLRKSVAARPMVKRDTGESLGRVTISLGVAELEPGDTERSFFGRADSSLYAAKGAGRNRVVHLAMSEGAK